ncbi:MAG: hypothetical protein IPM95_10270 [Sphingobacteriales bacterium]|nr:hypothetical protein [Sphingobacteriales bacterium]
MKYKKITVFLIICLIYNIFICDKGAMSIPDENLYYEAVLAMDALSQKNFPNFSGHINNTRGKPGDAIFRLPSVTLQGLLYHFKGISPANLDSLKIPVFFNILVNLVLLFVLYLLAELLFQHSTYALLTVILYKLLVNSNIYIRHILPYEKSLLCLLLVLYIYFRKRDKSILINFGLGILCGISFTIYPGYYYIPVFIGFIYFSENIVLQRNFRDFIKNGMSILSGFICIIFGLELFSYVGGESYLWASSTLSDTISQGSFDESLAFPVKYLAEVEQIPGFILLFTAVIMLFKSAKLLSAKKDISVIAGNPFYLLFCIGFIGIVAHGTLGTLFHKMVFYGRLMHLYMPFLVITLVYLIRQVKTTNRQILLFTAVLLFFSAHFIHFTIEYQKLGYPKDMLYDLKIDNRKFRSDQFYNESSDTLFLAISPNPINKKTNYPYHTDSNFILVNCCYYYPQENVLHYKPFTPSKNMKRVADRQHYQTFPAYTFEGLNRTERRNVRKRNYRIQFYKTAVL